MVNRANQFVLYSPLPQNQKYNVLYKYFIASF